MLVVSLSTIPPRYNICLNNIHHFYESQTIKPDIIMLNICHNYERFENKELVIPSNLQKMIEEKILIINYVEDMGPLTKLYPTILYLRKNFLQKYKNIDIITIDDDCTYINTTIQVLLKNAVNTNRKKIIGFFGFNVNNFDIGEVITYDTLSYNKRDEQEADIVGGANGCYYNSDFFSNNFDKYIHSLNFKDYLCDDELIGIYFLKIGIKKKIIRYSTFLKINECAYFDYALHKNNVRERQIQTIKNCLKIMDELITIN